MAPARHSGGAVGAAASFPRSVSQMQHPLVARPPAEPPALLPSLRSLSAVATTLTGVVVCALLLQHVKQPAHGAARHGGRAGERLPGCDFGGQPYYFEDSGSAAYDVTPPEWRPRAFDAACEPRDLVGPLLNASLRAEPSENPLVILTFGDRCARGLLTKLPLQVYPVSCACLIVLL